MSIAFEDAIIGRDRVRIFSPAPIQIEFSFCLNRSSFHHPSLCPEISFAIVLPGFREWSAIPRYVADEVFASICARLTENAGISTATKYSIDATPYFSRSPARYLMIELKKMNFTKYFQN
jgi:hypothetical protein